MFCSIAVSRSIGDLLFKDDEYTQSKKSGLIADPWIKTIQLQEEDHFCIVACDGLWDVITYQEACSFVSDVFTNVDSPQTAAELLVNKAYEMGSLDNITVLIIAFKYFKQ